jgi:prevent-host-death family protein
MERVPIRELQQHASAVIRRVRNGETIGVTDRGTLVAVLTQPSVLGGVSALVAAGRVRERTTTIADVPRPARAARPSLEVLDEMRADADG